MESGNVSNCNFIDNTAYENGGAIRMYSGNVTGCNFTGNTAVENGGAILSIICSEVRSSRFLYNRANLGSAIYNFNYEDCVFISNNEPQVYLDEEMRKKATMTIDVGDIFAKQDQNVIINLSGGISANVTAILNGTVISVEVINGTGILNLSGLNAGTYNLMVVFNGSSEYNATYVNMTFSVLKSNSTILIDVNDTYFGDDVIIVVTMPRGATGSVSIRVNEKLNFDKTIVDGRVSLSVPDLIIGEYTVQVSYDGDANYNGNMNTTYFEVIQNTFTRLQELIDGASDSLTLDCDYFGDGSEITIFKTITIDGNGHVLDAKGLSGIFYISAFDVVIKNLTFANGNSSGPGGSINVGNFSSTTIANCSFINSTSDYAGGAIYILYSSTILNCTFANSTAANAGGAIAVEGAADITGCSFTDSYANVGGAIALGDSANVDNCSFTGNSAKYGGAIYFDGDDCAISNSVFEYCSATDGGAIYANDKARVKYSTFSHNIASNLGGALYNCYYADCIFESNTEPEIYFGGEMRKSVNMTVEVPNNIMAGDNFTVIITISYNINASLTVRIDDSNKSVSLINGAGTLNLANMSAGSHEIIAMFNGTYEYKACNVSKRFIVSKIPTEITIANDTLNLKVNNSIPAGATLIPADVGNLTYISSNVDVAIVINGAIKAIGAGTAVITVGFEGNDMYAAAESKNITVNVSLNDAMVSVDNGTLDLKVGNIHTIVVTTVPIDLKLLNITYTSSNESVVTVDGNGTVTAVGEGNAIITVGVGDDKVYARNSTNVTVTVSKYASVVDITKTDRNSNIIMDDEFVYGSEFFIAVTNNTSPVIVTINGAEYPVSEGRVLVDTATLSAGKYTVIARIPESAMFNATEKAMTFTITRKPVAATIETVNIFVDENETVTVRLTENITCNVTVQIIKAESLGNEFIFIVPDNGTVPDDKFNNNYTVSVRNGVGSISIPGLPSGNYTATVYFNGNENYKPANVSSIFTVSKRNTVLNINVDDIHVGEKPVVNIAFTNNVTGNVTVRVKPVGGSIIASFSVMVENGKKNFTIPHVFIQQPSLIMSDFIAGDYLVEVDFPGNDLYDAVIASCEFTAFKYDLNVSAYFSNDDKTITITPASDITGNVTFIVDGKTYLIGSQGRTIDLSSLASASYTYTISYGGDGRYNEYSTSASITLTRKVAAMTIHVTNINYGQTENVEVTLPSDATGKVTFILLDDKSSVLRNTTSGIVNGKVTWQFPDLSAGKYNLNVIYSGSNAFESAENSTSFTVSKFNLNVNVDFINDDKTITVTPNGDIASNVIFRIANSDYPVSSQGRTIDLSGLENGNYTYTVSYSGDAKYNSYSSSGKITLTRISVNVTVEVEDMTYGDTQEVSAVVPGGATSEVNFVLTKDDEVIMDENVAVVEGVASVTLPQLNAGTYTLKASYAGDSVYERSSFYQKSFTVAPNIDISSKIKIGDDGKIVIEVGDIKGEIAVYVDDVKDGSRGIKNKNFTYYLPTDEYSVGYHNLTFEYIGSDLDENVFKQWDNETQQYVPTKYLINITQRPTEAAPDSDSDQKFSLVLKDDDGTPLSNATGNVTFIIMDEFSNVIGVEVVKVVDGIADLDISKYKDGNYKISWSYSGDEKHTPISRQVTLNIEHKAGRIVASDLKFVYTESKWYSVTVYGNDGKPLTNARTQFFAGGKLIGTATTNANGVASLRISHIPGTYSLTITAPGKTEVRKLTVDHIVTLKSVSVKRSAKKLVLTATLKKVNGKYLKGKTITFKFNGKKMSAKTNGKGVAKVTVKKNILKKLKKGKKVTYQATYLQDTVKKTTKIK